MDSYWSWYKQKFEEITSRRLGITSPLAESSELVSPRNIHNLEKEDLRAVKENSERIHQSKSGHPYDLRSAKPLKMKDVGEDPLTTGQLKDLFGADLATGDNNPFSAVFHTPQITPTRQTRKTDESEGTRHNYSSPIDVSDRLSAFIGWLHFAVVEAYLDYDFKTRFSVDNIGPPSPSLEIYKILFSKPWRRVILNEVPNQGKETMDCGVYACQFARCVGQLQKTDTVDFTDDDIKDMRLMMACIVGKGEIDDVDFSGDGEIVI